jgi:acyl dehydratase
MQEELKLEYSDIKPGYEFPPATHKMDSSIVSIYLKAVEDTDRLYQDNMIVPPTALAAYAMTSLSGRLSLPAGSIHVSQELEFLDTVSMSDTITCHARVSQKHERGRLHLMAVDFEVCKQDDIKVLTGKTSFILPGA